MFDIAQIHLEQHDFAKTVDLHIEVLAERQESLENEHSDTLWTMNNLDVALAMLETQKTLKETREMQVKTLQDQERILSLEHLYTEWTRKRMIVCY